MLPVQTERRFMIINVIFELAGTLPLNNNLLLLEKMHEYQMCSQTMVANIDDIIIVNVLCLLSLQTCIFSAQSKLVFEIQKGNILPRETH